MFPTCFDFGELVCFLFLLLTHSRGVKHAKPSQRRSTSKKVLGNKQLLKEVLAFGQSRSSNLSQLGGDGLCLEANEKISDKVESGF